MSKTTILIVDDKIENLVNFINKSAVNTFNLLEDLLLWARAQSGKLIFNPQELELSVIWSKVEGILEPIAKQKNITLKYICDDKFWVYADEDMLLTILRNLVTNAIKFSFRNGVVTIFTEENFEDRIIRISDNGIGISTELSKVLFDISQMPSTAGTEGEKGTGLGLLLCKEFVDKHGGKIWIESEVGKGCDIIFTLPLKKPFDHFA
jgi:signal transduction histidine kinase